MKTFSLNVFVSLLVCSIQLLPQNSFEDKKVEILGSPSVSYLNENNISTIFYNNGISDYDSSIIRAGFEFHKGSGKTAVFVSGLLWGLKDFNYPDFARIGGSSYRSGLQLGRILPSGLPEDPNAEHVRIYRVRPDVYPGGPQVDLSTEVNFEGKTETEIRNQYEKDWNEWFAEDGAPFIDKNGDGIYNPNIDVPGIEDAAQTIWFVANDLDTSLTYGLYNTLPIGIECQVTYWEYSDGSFLNNLYFRKYKLINKSSNIFEDMYVCMFSDIDIGSSNDDFAGCDSVMSLGYGYNAYDYDQWYFPIPPPTAGFDLLQGPIDSAGSVLPMTAFFYRTPGSSGIIPPIYNEALQLYRLMQGRHGLTNELIINPVTLEPTKYALSGDPLTGEGWLDGLLQSPGDRRIYLSSGPFNMAVGDTQEVILAEIAALGFDNLDSFRKLKFYSSMVQKAFDSGYLGNPLPKPPAPELSFEQIRSQIKLDWADNTQLLEQIENFDEEGFKFQGVQCLPG